MIKNKNGMIRKLIGAFLSIITVLSWNGIISTYADNTVNTFSAETVNNENSFNNNSVFASTLNLSDDEEVYVGGFPFGVKLYSEGLIIIGFSDIDCAKGSASPARDAGMEINDIILRVNDKKIAGASDFIETVEACEGKKLKIDYKRNNKEYQCEIAPSISETDGKYKTGMWLRDSTAGIGTVTFVDTKNGVFAGLGHGICDTETGLLVPMSNGITSGVRIESIKRGESGAPGELRGIFEGTDNGVLLKNTNNGVFGIFSDPAAETNKRIKLGTKDELRDGEAKIVCTLDNNKAAMYNIEITDIHRESTGNKNFIVTVTDEELIEKTGGIVQGMSGSPIIQNGKLVGAVTHVLINDPTKGYGIFVENMLETARSISENNRVKDAS